MDDKKQLQNGELENVSGGIDCMEGITYCGNCFTNFDGRAAKNRHIKDGCSAYYIYQCPHCGAWVKDDGKVYRG